MMSKEEGARADRAGVIGLIWQVTASVGLDSGRWRQITLIVIGSVQLREN